MNAKRGYLPEDDKNFSPLAVRRLQTASRHVLYLINEGYDLKQSATFVGNHFLMSERQRLAIMRSVSPIEKLISRRNRQVSMESLSGQDVWIDGFNTIITLEVMLNDSILFECMDGAIRDLAGLRGTYRLIPETEEAINIIFRKLQEAGVKKVSILLDEPVSNSGQLKTLIAEIAEKYPLELDVEILRDVDRVLCEKDRVITSDSIILDYCGSWVNLVEECMNDRGMKGIRVWEAGEEYADEENRAKEWIPDDANSPDDSSSEAKALHCTGIIHDTVGAFYYSFRDQDSEIFTVGQMIVRNPDVIMNGWGLKLWCKNLDRDVTLVPNIRRYVTDDKGKIYGYYEYLNPSRLFIWIRDEKINVDVSPEGWQFSAQGENIAGINLIPEEKRVKGEENEYKTETRYTVDVSDSVDIKWLPMIMATPVLGF